MAKEAAVKKRKSNIELLRILCTLMVITLHMLNPSLLKGVSYARASSSLATETVITWLFCASIVAVDIFILISGYFMINNNSRKLGKAINLIFVCSVYSVVKYLVKAYASGTAIAAVPLLKSIFPKSYYVYIYCAVYLLSPYINRAVDGIDKKSYKKLLGVMLVLFSVWPTVIDCASQLFGWKLTDIYFIAADGNGRGFTFVNFVLLYLIGGYLRKYVPDTGDKSVKYKSLALSFVCSAAVCAVSVAQPKLFGTNGIGAYNSIIIIIQAVALFDFFRRLNIGGSDVINFFAKASFGVFLLHMAVLPVVLKYIDMEAMFKKNCLSAIGCYLILLLSAYFVSAAFDSAARFVMTPVSKRWSKTKLFCFDTGFNEEKKS